MVIFSPVRRIRNTKRRILAKKFDYVYFRFPSEYTNREPAPKPFLQRLIFPDNIFSLEAFEKEIDKFTRSSKGKGLIIELPLGFNLPYGVINQVHSILQPLKDSGRELIVLSKTFDLRTYYFASFADKIYLVPSGMLDVRGLVSSIAFYKNSLDKIGLRFEKIAVSGYKSAFDNFARDDMAPESKENITWLLKSELKLIASKIQQCRTIKDFSAFLDNAPYTDIEALEKNFVDGLVRPDELPKLLKKGKKKSIKFIPFHTLHKALPIDNSKKSSEIIAVIPMTGMIIDGYSRSSPVKLPIPIFGDDQTGDLSILNIIRSIEKDDRVKGVILFMDTPGGSVTASETIRSALKQLNNKIPVIAYFNSVSASGGYYISTGTRWIISEPGCITGSIGVIMGKLSLKGFAEKQQITVRDVKEGKHANWGNLYEMYSEEERESSEKILDNLYQRFLRYVAENRKQAVGKIREIAGGRVYTGVQAFELGLVDQLGSFSDAYFKLCEFLGKKPNLGIVTFHPRKEMTPPSFVPKSLNNLLFPTNALQSSIEYISTLSRTKFWMLDLNVL